MTGEQVLEHLDTIARDLNFAHSGLARQLRGVRREVEQLLIDEEVINVA